MPLAFEALFCYNYLMASNLIFTASQAAYRLFLGSLDLGSDMAVAQVARPNRDLILLQPLDDSTRSLGASPGIQIFFQYFNLGWPWVLGIAAGIGVLWGVVGGIQIMLAGNESGTADGKNKIKYALFGLLMIGLAGFILRSLNPTFYQ